MPAGYALAELSEEVQINVGAQTRFGTYAAEGLGEFSAFSSAPMGQLRYRSEHKWKSFQHSSFVQLCTETPL